MSKSAAREDWREARRRSARAAIVDAAWSLVRDDGLAALSIRELAARAGITTPTVYAYFDSKHAIYDAMFQESNEELLRRMQVVRDTAGTPNERFLLGARGFVEFALEDLSRCQLLFLRTLPGFEPSPEAYAPAVLVLELARERLAEIGITRPEMLDIWTALLSGIMQQQWANDPGGDRWKKLLDDVIAMYLAYAKKRKS
jgi:AcrR family transcriptional regulator